MIFRLLALLLLLPPELVAADDFTSRSDLALSGAAADIAKLNGTSPMHYWVAQQMFERGEMAAALKIVTSGVKFMRQAIEKHEAAKSTNIGTNGFLYWGALNCYVKWHRQFPAELLEDYRYVFTHAHNYKGTTSNLGMIHTLALLLADHIWGAENLPRDGKYGPRGDRALKWLNDRVESIATRGSGEFASRPLEFSKDSAFCRADYLLMSSKVLTVSSIC